MAFEPNSFDFKVTIADRFVSTAEKIGLDVAIDQPTPSDGNCFYHAVIQQLHRAEIAKIVKPDLLSTTHFELRHRVVEFIRKNEFASSYIQGFRFLHESIIGNISWQKLLSEQEILGTYATELFIAATSFLFGVDIHITSDTNTITYPVTIISHHLNGVVDINNTSPFMLIGSISQIHFQSLIPVVTANQETDMSIDFSINTNSTGIKQHYKIDKSTKKHIHNEEVKKGNRYLHAENYFKELCATNGVIYLEPLKNETDSDIRNRRRCMKRHIQNGPAMKKKSLKKKEKELYCLCTIQKISYVSPSEDESVKQAKNRTAKLKRLCNKDVTEKNQEKKKKVEEELKGLCTFNKVTYVPPCEDESEQQTKNRQRKLKRQCYKDVTEKKTEGKKQKIEEEMEDLCHSNEVTYVPPCEDESARQTKNRHRKLKRQCYKDITEEKTEGKKQKIEEEMEDLCYSNEVTYVPPCEDESAQQTKNRHKKLKQQWYKDVDKHILSFKKKEEYLKDLCTSNKIMYMPPCENEAVLQTKNRRMKLKRKCENDYVSTNGILKKINDLLNELLEKICIENIDQTLEGHANKHKTIKQVDDPLQSLHSNPKVTEAIVEFEKGEMKHEVNTCNVCLETRPIFNSSSQNERISIQPWKLNKDGICNRCKKDQQKRKNFPKKAAKFSGCYSKEEDLGPAAHIIRHNNMHFQIVPPFLQNLTTVEVALISRITVVMNIHSLKKGGMFSSHGHSISIPQKMKIVNILPLLPTQVGLIILKRNKENLECREYKVKRQNVEDAIKGLCFGYPHGGITSQESGYVKYDGPDHINKPLNGKFFLYMPNYKYSDVVIAQSHLDILPERFSQLQDLNIVKCQEKSEMETDRGPAPAQFEMDVESNDESKTSSGISILFECKDTKKHLQSIIKNLTGSDSSLKINENSACFDWDFTTGDPLNELKTPGFFTMAFPTVFINGSCDITGEKLFNIDFDEFVSHIYYTGDSRVSKHPYLKFFLYNLGLRMKALSQGSFLVAQQLNDAHLTIEELQQNLNNDDESVPRKIISMGANLQNTDPYWRERKNELESLIIYRNKEYDELPAYFDTNSCAEFHWVPLLELLIKHHSKVNNIEENLIKTRVKNNSSFRRKLIYENLHIVTHYFDARTKNYYNTVGQELFQYDDIWWRYEFAKSRGAIHSHAIISSSKHALKVKDALGSNHKKAENLYKWLQSNEMNTQNVFSPTLVSMHPAGGKSAVSNNGIKEWIPDKSKWPKPEGSQSPPLVNPLTENISSKLEDANLLHDFHTSLVNRIGLHECSSYCLRFHRKKDVDNNKYSSAPFKYCRFHFGDQNPETKNMTGKELHPDIPVITLGEHPRYEGPNDHPRMVMHSKPRLLSWQANCDTQAIIDEDLMALLKYVASYACKGSASTEDLVNCWSKLLDSSNENTTIRNVTQRLLMKIIGVIDVSAANVDYLNTGGKLFHCTRKFQKTGLSGYRVLSKKSVDGIVTKETPLDRFLSDSRQKENPTMTLWDWANKCRCKKKCPSDHIAVFTGLPSYPKWPISEDYAQRQLMIFSAGTWKSVEELKNNFESYTESFANFLDTEDCPLLLHELMKFAKAQYDKKLQKKLQRSDKEKRDGTKFSLNLSQSTCSQVSQMSNTSEFFIGQLLMQDIARENQMYLNEPIGQDNLPNGGPDFDWNQYGLSCFGSEWPLHAKEWITDIGSVAEKEKSNYANSCTLPNINLLSANSLQRVIISINLINLLSIAKGQQIDQPLRLLIQGTAGVGKTYIIKALTYITRRLFKKNMSVMNLAPTGAAAILLPDGRTVHSTTPIPRNIKKKDFSTVQLQDYPLKDNQFRTLRKLIGFNEETKNFNLVCLNLDERGMWSKRLLAWSSQRFKEVTESMDQTFGDVPVVNFFGDLGQLGPIGEKDLHVCSLKSDSPDMQAGYAIYRSFCDCVVLTKTMRQGADQLKLLNRLLRVRNGTIKQQDWIDVNSRYEDNLSDIEKKNFCHERVLTLMETWAEVNIENHSKLSGLNVPVAVLPSTGRGTHHAQTEKQVGQIVSRCLIAVGARVILTKNQGSLTSLGLNNGAIGKVIALLYSKGVKPPDFPEAVVVDFPNYQGPPWIEQHKTWIPISVTEGRCDSNCCSRVGFPLMPGYAIPIAKSQGMSIGADKDASHVRIKLQESKVMEQLNLGTTYTALSRCERELDWCLVQKIPQDRLLYINDHPQMKGRQMEESRLVNLSKKTVHAYNIYATDNQAYINLIKEMDSFCNDGITDHIP